MIERIKQGGLLAAIYYYYRRIGNFLYVLFTFGRTDLNIPFDSRINGIKNIKWGKRIVAGRGFWLEAVDNYGECLPKQEFTPQLIVGDDVSFGEYVHIGCNNKIIIGNNVLFGSKIYVTDHNHGNYADNLHDAPCVPPKKRPLSEDGYVVIEDNVWIGENCVILPRVTIGQGCIIGSNSVITHDIPAGCIAVGNPARIIKKYNIYIKKWVKCNE